MISNGDNNKDDETSIMGGQVAAGIPPTMKAILVHGWGLDRTMASYQTREHHGKPW